jgi:hypothetical protein
MIKKSFNLRKFILLCSYVSVVGLITNCAKDVPQPENPQPSELKATSSYVPPANAIYIDPSAKVNGTGTQASPLNGSTFQAQYSQPWKANATYLLKSGTTLDVKYKLWIQANNVTLGAYGTGNRPIIRSSVNNSDKVLDMGNMKDITIRDLEIFSTANASAIVNFMYNVRSAVINCKIHDGEWGIRNMNSSGQFRVLNCEVYNTGDDGCFIANMDSLEFGGNYIHNVNLKYFVDPSEKYAAGDGLQLGNIQNFYIHDNTIDHSGTGDKFCLLLNTDQTGFSGKGIIERNTFKRDQTGASTTIFYTNFTDNSHTIIRYNKFVNADVAISNHSKNLQVYYNEFINIYGMAFDAASPAGSNSNVFNNTFYNVNRLVFGYGETVNFKNNIVYNCTGTAFVGGANINPDYNCYYQVSDFGITNTGSHSIKADPKFTNVSGLDFSLQSSSPCINKGTNVLGTYKDFAGSAQIGSAVDMGALEYGSVVNVPATIPPPVSVTGTGATFYSDCGLSGTSVTLAPGSYTTANLVALGIPDNSISSLKVNGFKVIVYTDNNFTGTSLTLTADNGCLSDAGFNDKISSIKISN